MAPAMQRRTTLLLLAAAALVQLAAAQLPNARIGLDPSGHGPDLQEQPGYPIV